MVRNSKHGFVKTCVFAVICLVAVMISFRLLPAAKAHEHCLRIAMPEIHADEQKRALYRKVMEEAGLCVQPLEMPKVRAISALRSDRIDGVFAGRNDLPTLSQVSLVRGDVLLGSLDGYLIVREGSVGSIADLNGEVLGVSLGASWSRKLVKDYSNVVNVPRGAVMLPEMLAEGRIDAMLLDAYSLALSGGVPDGYKAVSVDHFDVYSWLKAEHADLKPQFDRGTRAYMEAVGR